VSWHLAIARRLLALRTLDGGFAMVREEGSGRSLLLVFTSRAKALAVQVVLGQPVMMVELPADPVQLMLRVVEYGAVGVLVDFEAGKADAGKREEWLHETNV
jgi:hypothetical protein